MGEIVDIKSGRDYKHLSPGDIPVFGTGGYMLSVSEALSKSDDAIGIGRKGTIDRPFVLCAPFWTVDTLFYAIPSMECILEFIFCIFQKIDWSSFDESTGVPSLSKSTISNVRINICERKEQGMIAQLFIQLDNLITLHQRKPFSINLVLIKGASPSRYPDFPILG